MFLLWLQWILLLKNFHILVAKFVTTGKLLALGYECDEMRNGRRAD